MLMLCLQIQILQFILENTKGVLLDIWKTTGTATTATRTVREIITSDGYYTPNEKKKKGVTPAQFIVCLLAVALIFGTAGAYLGGRINKEQAPTLDSSNMIVEEPNKDDVNKTDPEASDDSVSKPENSEHPSDKLNIANDGQDSTNATGVVQNCMASVVGIYVGNTTISYATGETQEQDTGSGSGVIITDDGYIVTNNHVVQGADTIHVYLQDGTKYDAKLIGTDTFSDLAIVKIDVANLPAATIGSSGNVTVGDTVYAIGNPLGVLTSSVSKGIISGLDRTITIDGISMTLMQTRRLHQPRQFRRRPVQRLRRAHRHRQRQERQR